MKKKFFLMLPCIAAVAIATFVGKKTFESHAFMRDALFAQNVEALSLPTEKGGWKAVTSPCPPPIEYKRATVCSFGFGKEYNLFACMNSDC